ncbi:PREDICTED: glutathione S-transferase kappa 1-like [Amphimedon queenslandica]|uniref:Glutathione S-transferase kappa n=1 Tax=Amphimedon queenslandica TaxID=400682 RepID=A0A1X7U0W3_AMPQE|nr:PREDICTED: glutathione S-transferase kappa 1-like [Amphimedon queenslandica]|eukprot:XP_019856690.1 PREDICTED: glutathione S-transferase kappa 1-like [Amphimedon queenslandica]
MATKVKLYYDVVSPYTWVAFEVLCRYRSRWNMSLELKPFFLGGIMQLSGNRPPGMVPNKAAYMVTDLKRLRKYYDVPLNIPKNPVDTMLNKGSLSAQRLLIAVRDRQPEKLEELSRQLWLRIWSRDEDITAEESLREACQASDISSDLTSELLSSIKDVSIKDKLKATTQEAFDLGAFGSPFIVAYVDGKPEPFFGTDRFEILAQTIGENWEGPLVNLKAKY